jgi:hypothetical protein
MVWAVHCCWVPGMLQPWRGVVVGCVCVCVEGGGGSRQALQC